MNPLPPSRPTPALDRCGLCGQPSGAPERCPHCGGSLLVDVLVEGPVAGAREVYAVARAAAAAGVPGLDFAAARAALERPGAPLAAALRRDRARALVASLDEAGHGAVVRAAAAPPARRLPAAAVAGGVAAVALVAALVVALRGRPPAAPAPGAAVAPPPAAEAALAPSPATSLAAAGAGAGDPAAGRELSVEELARSARPALAVLTCAGRLGSGFFVAPERVLTNAHVTCGADVPLEVKLADGRQLVGRVRAQDAWLDYAVVQVPGANLTPLPLGDSTALVAGSPVVLVGSPLGLEATVHAGKVSFAARNLEGVAHVQVNADVNPGNSGGPLLDARGRVVGIVTLKAAGASGVGFALPIEYARGELGAPEPDAEAARRWSETVARVAREDDAEAARLLARLERPLLVAAGAAVDRLALVVMQRASGGPSTATVSAEIRDGARVLCKASGEVREWQAIEEKLKAADDQDRATRTARWMLRRKITASVYSGAAVLDVSACPEETSARAVVALEGTTAPDETQPYPGPELAAGRREARARASLSAGLEEASRARAEGQWRSAFRLLRDRIAHLEVDQRLLRGALERRDDAQLMERARRELPAIEAELTRRREELQELERRASNEAIPREWRQ